MRTFLTCIAAFFGVIAISASASAEPQYVWVHYGDGEPYLYVTETPHPAHTATHPVSYKGVTFDSDVGVVCGAVNTRVNFDPFTSTLDQRDRSTLASLANCFTRGPMHGKSLKLIVAYDGTPDSEKRMYERLGKVLATLQQMGMSESQLIYTKEVRPDWQDDHVSFRLATPVPSLERIPLDPHRCNYIGPLSR
jgi:hypothetical protein